MTKRTLYIALISLLICFFYSTASGCKYTVRDIGFTDIGSVPYKLYYYIFPRFDFRNKREDTPENLTSEFKSISYATFLDSNIEVEIVNVKKQKDHPALRYVNFWEIKSFPATVLVSPKGKSSVIPISDSESSFKETLWTRLESVVFSPKRKEILQNIVDSYSVVLLILGTDRSQNENAQKEVKRAIDQISKIMSQMTRTIKEPPHLMVISQEHFSEEKILLWSIGIDENEFEEPRVAVIYGRGRQIGPLFKGKQITTKAVYNIFSLIGLACECGLDTKGILGSILPLRWSDKFKSKVASSLGFDAESPMVKTEVSQILSMGTTNSARTSLNEYSEKAIEFKSGQSVGMISPAQFQQMNSPQNDSLDSGSNFRITIYIVIGMVLLILAGGIFIILRSQKRISRQD